MSIPSNRNEFLLRLKQNLGHPVIQINVTDEQIDNRIDEALYEFYRRHHEAVENIYMIIQGITDEQVAQGYINLPEDIIGVSEVFRVNNVSNIWSIDFQYQMAELYSLSNVMRHGGIFYFYTQRMHLKLLNQMFSPDRQFNFNAITNDLIIAGGLKDTAQLENSIVIKCFRKVIGTGETTPNTNSKVANIWKSQWLIDYATALVKYQWGQNLGKYREIELLGGVKMNGGEIKQEATEELKELKQELIDQYSLPIDFLIG